MNTAEYETISRQYLPLYTNITVNIGTEAGLHPPPPPPPAKAAVEKTAQAPAKGSAQPPATLEESHAENASATSDR